MELSLGISGDKIFLSDGSRLWVGCCETSAVPEPLLAPSGRASRSKNVSVPLISMIDRRVEFELSASVCGRHLRDAPEKWQTRSDIGRKHRGHKCNQTGAVKSNRLDLKNLKICVFNTLHCANNEQNCSFLRPPASAPYLTMYFCSSTKCGSE